MYDLAVLGAGPGGYVAAIKAAQQGLKVLLVEKDRVGGTCLNRGCIPTKSFLSDLKILDLARTSRVLVGGEGLDIDINRMVKRKNRVVDIQVRGLGGIIQGHGIQLEQGRGEILDPQSIRVEGEGGIRNFKARNIILATGSETSIPLFVKVDGHFVISTNEALNPDVLPKTMIIIGGGVVGVEFATIYQALGTKVTMLEMLPDIIMGEDEEVRSTIRKSLLERDIQIYLEARVTNVNAQAEGVVVTFDDKAGNTQDVKGEKVLVATGRKPNMDGIDVEVLGLKKEGPYIQVNSKMQTNIPGIYAIGDLIGGWMLAHAASAEGETAVENILGQPRSMKQELVPRCVYSFLEVASVGLTEQQARDSGLPVKTGKHYYKYSGKAHAMDAVAGFVKIVGNALSGEILGTSIVGEHATDLIGEIQLAMTVEAAVEDLWDIIKAHPTLGECVREAALSWENRAIHMPKATPS